MAENSPIQLVPIDLREEANRRRSEPFRGARAEGRGWVEFTAAARGRLLDLWRAAGREGRPEAVKPLRGEGRSLGLLPCDLATPGRIPLTWSRKGRTVAADLGDIFTLLQVTIPRDHWIDLTMIEQVDANWGNVLFSNLEDTPARRQERRVRRGGKRSESQPAPGAGATDQVAGGAQPQ